MIYTSRGGLAQTQRGLWGGQLHLSFATGLLVGNPCERSSFLLGLGMAPGEQLRKVGGTGGTVPFLVLARGSGLKELPALPSTGFVFSWPQDQVGGNSFFSFCLGHPPSVLWMSSLMIFAPERTSAPSGSSLLQNACRQHSAFSPSVFVGVGLWVTMAGLDRSLLHPDEIGGIIP